MSNGTRRTQAAGLKASAGSNVSKRYKAMKRKMGVKGSIPGNLLNAWNKMRQGMKGPGWSDRPGIKLPGEMRRKPGAPTMQPKAKPVMLAKKKSVKRKMLPSGMEMQRVPKSMSGPISDALVRGLRSGARGITKPAPMGPQQPSRARRLGRRVRGAVQGLKNAPREFAQGLKGRKSIRRKTAHKIACKTCGKTMCKCD